ncbi:hypothetical protein PanWU01x14_187120 [Parasponia andersonii]|uniref:Uncharacterized protein n=1 Tax=Parasponia andersonii TaxID=3476 RepID=A0A2P5C3U3_PARAD|nr:hypothetical protein PanWU01x14_187120 [Parasponia andersonii]
MIVGSYISKRAPSIIVGSYLSDQIYRIDQTSVPLYFVFHYSIYLQDPKMFQVFLFGSKSRCYFGVFGGCSRFLCQKVRPSASNFTYGFFFRLHLEGYPQIWQMPKPFSLSLNLSVSAIMNYRHDLQRDSEKAMTQSFNFTTGQSTSAINMKEE